MSAWIPPVPDGATTIFDFEAAIGSLADIKAGDIGTVITPGRRVVTSDCWDDDGDLVIGDWIARWSDGDLADLTVLRAFRLAPVSVPLPTEGAEQRGRPMSEQPPALDPATLGPFDANRLIVAAFALGDAYDEHADRVPEDRALARADSEFIRAATDVFLAAGWQPPAAHAEQQAATPPDVRKTAERALLDHAWGRKSACGCGWRVQAVSTPDVPDGASQHAAHIADMLASAGVLASTPRPEGETRVEWCVRDEATRNAAHAVSRLAALEWLNGLTAPSRLVRRTVTSFPDVVGEWMPVEQDGDDR